MREAACNLTTGQSGGSSAPLPELQHTTVVHPEWLRGDFGVSPDVPLFPFPLDGQAVGAEPTETDKRAATPKLEHPCEAPAAGRSRLLVLLGWGKRETHQEQENAVRAERAAALPHPGLIWG